MEYLAELDSDTERFEAEALVQFEAQGRRKEIEQIGTVPVWFIPPYQVQRGEYIASGSFGSVYRGRWLDTDVAVKRVLTNCTLPMYRDQFRHELDLWFSLNHEKLIIEVVSGEYPWGPKLADAVVAQNVANRKQIPPRPNPFRDDEWDLIELMCCFDPSERISMAAVSRIAYEIGSNWEMN
ncbi:TKL protein kinase [Phytophthora cinnamomi]|uniref:TKL protein kinase n=1 Tax=Phytophthora cinnamomi TaxID=4785 RepID=UPI00355A7727|nr:TKL protein kinase [Phytophthora cinnamomi]